METAKQAFTPTMQRTKNRMLRILFIHALSKGISTHSMETASSTAAVPAARSRKRGLLSIHQQKNPTAIRISNT